MSRELVASPFVRWTASFDARLHLICFPYAGAGAGIFREWRLALPREVGVWAVRLPGRESRIGEPPIESVSASVAHLTAMYPMSDEPVALLGHCSGGQLAFEFARALRDRGQPVVKLIIVARHAPRVASAHRVAGLPREAFRRELGRLGGTSGAVGDDELFELLEPVIRADFKAAETHEYRAAPPLTSPITVVVAHDDEWVPREAAMAWQHETTGEFRLVTIPGTHLLREYPRLLTAAVTSELLAFVGPT